MRKKVLLLSAGLLILLGCSSCMEIDPAVPPRALNFTMESEPSLAPSEYPEVPQMPQDYETSEAYRINRANVYKPGESFSQYGLYIERLNVRKTKALPEDVDIKNFKYFNSGDSTDEAGRLLEETSYLFLDLKVRNYGEEPLTLSWNAAIVFATDGEGYLVSDIMLTPWEARYRSGRELEEYAKDYFKQTLEPAETAEVTIGFVIDDRYIDDENLYFAPACGLSADLYNKWKIYRLNDATGQD